MREFFSESWLYSQRVLSTHMGNTYPNQKGNSYYKNHTLYHIGTLDPFGYSRFSIGLSHRKEGEGVRGTLRDFGHFVGQPPKLGPYCCTPSAIWAGIGIKGIRILSSSHFSGMHMRTPIPNGRNRLSPCYLARSLRSTWPSRFGLP